eukprot:SM000006S19364  [mRNA]  locus=s6:293956:296086:- [translate_table: standard]
MIASHLHGPAIDIVNIKSNPEADTPGVGQSDQCALQFESAISATRGLSACTGQPKQPAKKSCCSRVSQMLQTLAIENPDLYLAVQTQPSMNEPCKKEPQAQLAHGVKLKTNIFKLCPNSKLLPQLVVTPANKCPVTLLGDVSARVKLPKLAQACADTSTACSTCVGNITQAATKLAQGSSSKKVAQDCQTVVMVRLAQSQASSVAYSFVAIESGCKVLPAANPGHLLPPVPGPAGLPHTTNQGPHPKHESKPPSGVQAC